MATAKVLALKVPLFYIPGWQSEVDKSHEKYKIHSVILNIYTKNHVQVPDIHNSAAVGSHN